MTLFEPGILWFVFSPLLVSAVLIVLIGFTIMRRSGGKTDGSARLLAVAVRNMPESRRDWARAMTAELAEVHGRWSRWMFALGCARAALFAPVSTAEPREIALRRGPCCGLLSVTLPPLGLPILFAVAVAADVFLKVDGRAAGEVLSPGLIRAVILFTVACMAAGLPLGIAGLIRRERARWLSVMGLFLSVGVVSYTFTVLHLIAGGPNGD